LHGASPWSATIVPDPADFKISGSSNINIYLYRVFFWVYILIQGSVMALGPIRGS
jgi:hypothetical protein